ncbi:MAG: TonB-dependent receptor plug domain-containing protein, partial [Duncaniella sp.]|nr:TonB-dependent receptor plug domain-containing protein [Duncaniella sp.]
MLALSPCASAQNNKSLASTMKQIDNKTVVGQVFDEDDEPLAGATVMLRGTDNGVATDMDGQFSILVSGKDPVLDITYIGMKPVSLPIVSGSKFLRVKMQRAENMMSEIVVTGYQNIKRESATGAYQILSAEEMDKRYTGDIASNLEGRIPGLVRYEKTAGAVANPEDAIIIRGMGTFEAKSTPLVVVDGLPIEGGMNTVNPYDVENITVLKDAAAASIYGARAANGVIVITTKQAKKEKLTVDFNADLTITEKQKYDNYSWLDAAGMIELERYNFNGLLNDPDPTYLQSVENIYDSGLMTSISPVCRLLLQNYRGQLSDSDLESTLSRLSRNNYRKEYQDVHDRTGIMQQYNLALRIQGKSLSSSIVLNYSDDNAGIKKEYYKSLTFKYRGDLKAAKWLDLSFGVNVLNNRNKTHNFSDYYGSINSFLPYQSMYDENGNPAGLEADVYLKEDAFNNPDYELKDHSYNL